MSYSFPSSASGVRIDVAGKPAAFCRSEEGARAVLSFESEQRALGIGPDTDVDVVLWSDTFVDGERRHTETTLWSLCGWSLVDFTGKVYPR